MLVEADTYNMMIDALMELHRRARQHRENKNQAALEECEYWIKYWEEMEGFVYYQDPTKPPL